MSLDSKAALSGRVKVLGLGEFVGKFVNNGWDTMAYFAFATSYVPGMSAEDVFMVDIVTPILGNGHPQKKSALRRLFFECYTLAAADLERKVERGYDDAPRRIPHVEREERKAALERRLVGVEMDKDLEPSDSLIDLCVQMIDDNQVS